MWATASNCYIIGRSPVAGHLPQKQQDYKQRYRTLASTYLTFSPDGAELLVNLGGEQIYLFDVNRSRKPQKFDIPMVPQASKLVTGRCKKTKIWKWAWKKVGLRFCAQILSRNESEVEPQRFSSCCWKTGKIRKQRLWWPSFVSFQKLHVPCTRTVLISVATERPQMELRMVWANISRQPRLRPNLHPAAVAALEPHEPAKGTTTLVATHVTSVSQHLACEKLSCFLEWGWNLPKNENCVCSLPSPLKIGWLTCGVSKNQQRNLILYCVSQAQILQTVATHGGCHKGPSKCCVREAEVQPGDLTVQSSSCYGSGRTSLVRQPSRSVYEEVVVSVAFWSLDVGGLNEVFGSKCHDYGRTRVVRQEKKTRQRQDKMSRRQKQNVFGSE